MGRGHPLPYPPPAYFDFALGHAPDNTLAVGHPKLRPAAHQICAVIQMRDYIWASMRQNLSLGFQQRLKTVSSTTETS